MYSFVLNFGRFRKHRALLPLRSEKLLQYSFWHFVDTWSIVRLSFRMHFADILNSQLMYTVQLLMRLYLDTLISERMISFADSLFKFLLLPPSRFLDPLLVLAFGIMKLLHPVRPKQRV